MRVPPLLLIVFVVIAGCGRKAADDAVNPVRSAQIPRIVSAQDALDSSELATLDPHTMNDAEITKALGEVPFCAFRYVSDGNPVLAWSQQAGDAPLAVVKLNGLLVRVQGGTGDSSGRFVADGLRLTLTSGSPARQTRAQRPQEADLVFEIDQRLRVGYGGYLACPS